MIFQGLIGQEENIYSDWQVFKDVLSDFGLKK